MKVEELMVVWLQLSGDSGCSVSLMNSIYPSINNILLDEIVPGKHINLLFHPTLMAGSGEAAIKVVRTAEKEKKGKYILVVEGAVTTAKDGVHTTVGEENGKHIKGKDIVESMGRNAMAVIALGSCAAYGGIQAGTPNPTGAVGVLEYFKKMGIGTPVINIPGCPAHPGWFVDTVAGIILKGLPGKEELDELNRPKSIFSATIHENCPRRSYFDAGKFAKKFGDEGCLYELGCKGPIASADCPLRRWNGKAFPIDTGAPCNACVEPEFPDKVSPFYEKIKIDKRLYDL